MNKKEKLFTQEVEKLMYYEGDTNIVRKYLRSPFDFLWGANHPLLYEYVRLKVLYGMTTLTKEEYNRWIIQSEKNESWFGMSWKKAKKNSEKWLIK